MNLLKLEFKILEILLPHMIQDQSTEQRYQRRRYVKAADDQGWDPRHQAGLEIVNKNREKQGEAYPSRSKDSNPKKRKETAASKQPDNDVLTFVHREFRRHTPLRVQAGFARGDMLRSGPRKADGERVPPAFGDLRDPSAK